jgi:ligand-binding sensor domain-containing protein
VNIPISPNFITSIAEDSSGKIWVGTHLGVRIFDDVQAKQIDSITTTNGLSHNITTCIFADHEANMWIGTIDGLNCFKDNVIKVYRGADGLSNNHITAICEDKDKNLWFGTYKGLSRLSHNKWARMTSADGLTHDHVLSIMEDYEGSLWVCTLEGLNRFKDVNITSYTTRDGLTSDNLSSIAETPDGSLYFLSDVDGTITQLKDGKFKTYSTSVGTAYVARDGSLWIGQTGLLINIKNGQLKRYTAQTGFPNLWISAITEDDKSLILYVNGIGIRRFVNGQIRPYLMKDGKQYPSTEYIVCFYSKPGGVLWIGATHGLTKIENGESKVFLKANGLAGDWVNAIFEDQRGSLWICSPRDGLTHYKDGKFTIFTTKIGLFTDEIYCVLCDNQGDLWLSSPRGIGHVKRKEIDDYESGKIKSINTQVYVTADGMKSDECFGGWQPAGWKTHDGRLWFATKKGAVMIDPKAFKRNKLQPPVLIDKVVADQQIVPLGSYASLKPGIGKLEFHYTALSFLVPERVLFKYKLEGYDQDWVEARTQRVAYYMNLPPGNYQFQVMACNNDGVWNKTGASFAFRLEPHFYETYWFYGIVLIAFGGIVFGIIRLRIWRLVKKEKELQVRIQEALANIKTLSGLIPICASCKKIRDDRGYWDQLEEYIQSRSEVTFSHGICPDCVEKLYPGLYKAKKNP